jgi:hypothetical protein
VHIAKNRYCGLQKIRHVDDNMTNLRSIEPLISMIIPTKNEKWNKRNAHRANLMTYYLTG